MLGLACSGLMYPGVPTRPPAWVNAFIVTSSSPAVSIALAIPKSMILGPGFPSTSVIRMFEGLRSRCTIAFWWACWTPSQTLIINSMRSRTLRCFCLQYVVMGRPDTYSITK